MKDSLERIDAALDIAFEYGQAVCTDHLAWCIDQMVRALTGEAYEEWVEEYETGDDMGESYDWYTGISP